MGDEFFVVDSLAVFFGLIFRERRKIPPQVIKIGRWGAHRRSILKMFSFEKTGLVSTIFRLLRPAFCAM